jgi:D-alanyl-lipoteichoic acid acyltransferase DltB (MBOAT superfamily)
MFIADSLANIVNPIFASDPPYSGTMVLIGTYAFVFQVLCDFDGYSNIARGLGKIMGFDIFVNFNLPLFATNIQDFWRRWHITLSSWVRDYLYIPLGGNRKGNIRTHINLMISMVAIGFWHGAAWHYIWFGVFEGSLLILYRIFKPYLNQLTGPKSGLGQKICLVLKILFMFQVTSLGYMFFRSKSITQTLHMLHALIFNFTVTPDFIYLASSFLFFVSFFLIIQIYQFKKEDLMIVMKWPAYGKTIFALAMVYLSLYAMILGKNAQIGSSSSFFYFQF